MPNTTNFNWPTPADTDLVKDGAAAIRNLGNGVDTSLVDLKGGTTGQILSKASNTDMDFIFITPNVGDLTEVQAGVGISVASGTGPIPIITNSSTDLITTAGDLLYGTAADTVARLGIGTAGQFLKVNSGATAPEWITVASSAFSKIASGTFTNAATVAIDSVFSATYRNYVAFITMYDHGGTSGNDAHLQFRYAGPLTQATNYYQSGFAYDNGDTLTRWGVQNGSEVLMAQDVGTSTAMTNFQLNFAQVGNSSQQPRVNGFGNGGTADKVINFSASNQTARTYTGFLIKGTANITGSYAVYGLEN